MPTIPAPMNNKATSACKNDCNHKANCRYYPLQPIVHSQLGKSKTGMQDQRYDGWTNPEKYSGYGLEIAEIDVKGAQRCDDHKIWKDKRPAAGPCPPKAGPQIGNVHADLDRKRSRQRLADGNCFAHLFLRQPSTVGDQLALHLTNEGDRPAEPQEPKP